jgi:VWFA-related protein
MNHAVASFVLLVSLLSTSIVAQTNERGAKKERQRPSARSGNLQICQGVPLPDGYTIVAYVTSSTCPHGAYLLKKREGASDGVVTAHSQSAPSQTSIGPVQNAAASGQSQASRPRRTGIVGTGSDPSFAAATEPRPPTLSGITTPKSDPRPPTLTDSRANVTGPIKMTPAATPAESSDVEEVGAGDVVRINTALVTVPVSVYDRQGRFVPDLRRDDFHVFEDGVEQHIAYFEPTEKPFTVALLLDMSASTRFHLWQIKEAAIAFAKQLRPQDRVLVVTFSDEVLLLTEPTNNGQVIDAVIETNAQPGSSTRLYDAVNLVINERLNKIQGRKAIVLFTDGVDTSSYLASYQSTLGEAEELDALIYPIQYDTTDYARVMQNAGNVSVVSTTNNWPFPGSSTSSRVIYDPILNGQPAPGTSKADYERADKYLHAMADSTGGRLYQANDPAQLAQAFSRIAEELRRQYSIGYYPQTGTDESRERRAINVKVQRPNVAVKSRNGYVRRTASAPANQ